MTTGGVYRHRVDILVNQKTQDATGAEIDDWVTFAKSVPANVRPLAGREYYEAHQVNAALTHRIKIRFTPGVKSNMRVLHRDVSYDIKSPAQDLHMDQRSLTLMCELCE